MTCPACPACQVCGQAPEEREAQLRAALDAAQADVRRLRALPVLRTCADCTWMGGFSGGSVTTPYTCGLASHRELPGEDIIPDWCPMRENGDCGAQDAPGSHGPTGAHDEVNT